MLQPLSQVSCCFCPGLLMLQPLSQVSCGFCPGLLMLQPLNSGFLLFLSWIVNVAASKLRFPVVSVLDC